MSLDFWAWRYRDTPYPGTFIALAWDGPKLAAHYAVSPQYLSCCGEPVPAALSMTTMTHPDYAGRGLFTKLAELVYAQLQDEGYGVVYGFPNTHSHSGFVRKLGWKDVVQLPQLRIPAANLLRANEERLQLCSPSTPEHWQGMQRVALSNIPHWGIYASAAWLQWRYAQLPGHPYRIRCVPDGDFAAFLVYKIFEAEERRFIDVLQLEPSTAISPETLLASALREAQAESDLPFEGINLWCNLHERTYPELEKLAAVPVVPLTFFGLRTFGDGMSDTASDPRLWRMYFGASDVY